MDKFVVSGGRSLRGEVQISGSKNASLPVMAACLLSSGKNVLRNVPSLADLHTMTALFSNLGVKATQDGDTLILDTSGISSVEATYDIVRKMRASCLVLGPLLARFGRARVSLPGGCAIGARPIDLHLKGFEAMGAKIILEHGYVDATAPAGGLVGAKIVLDMPSVGATENLMIAATLARGSTWIENAAREPEIVELAKALQNMGALIAGAGESIIKIEGVDSLRPLEHRVGPDRIEAGTLMAAVAMTGGDVVLKDVMPETMDAVMSRFVEAGCEFQVTRAPRFVGETSDVRMRAPARLKAIDMRTSPYPGFPTDMQAQFMACMTVAQGTSQIEETIFENRFMHTLELLRMGADISMHGNVAVVKGVERLSGAPVMATDLRASASLVLAALRAEGETEILRIYHLDRGYAQLETKLNNLGANIRREKQ